MPRTDSTQVAALMEPGKDYDGVSSLTPYITAANVITSRVATCASTKGLGLSTDELTAIETWLAAHFYQCSDQGYNSKTTGKASASFQGQTGMQLELTKYGQMAMTIDYSGCLTAINKRQFAFGYSLGSTYEDQVAQADAEN